MSLGVRQPGRSKRKNRARETLGSRDGLRHAGDRTTDVRNVAKYLRLEAPPDQYLAFFGARIEGDSVRFCALEPWGEVGSPLPAHDRSGRDACHTGVDIFGPSGKCAKVYPRGSCRSRHFGKATPRVIGDDEVDFRHRVSNAVLDRERAPLPVARELDRSGSLVGAHTLASYVDRDLGRIRGA